MKVILLQDVKKLGKKDQVIEVSDGYAINFLFPRKLAVQLTKKSNEVLSNQQEERVQLDLANQKKAHEVAEQLKSIIIEFKVKSGANGKIFGSISLKQVEEEMKKQFNIEIDKRRFIDKGPLDTLGIHLLKIDLYKGIIGQVKVHICELGN